MYSHNNSKTNQRFVESRYTVVRFVLNYSYFDVDFAYPYQREAKVVGCVMSSMPPFLKYCEEVSFLLRFETAAEAESLVDQIEKMNWNGRLFLYPRAKWVHW